MTQSRQARHGVGLVSVSHAKSTLSDCGAGFPHEPKADMPDMVSVPASRDLLAFGNCGAALMFVRAEGHNDGASQGYPMDVIKATQCADVLPID